MRRMMLRLLVGAVALLAAAAPAGGQNVLANPDFSSGLGGWEVLGSTWFTVVYDPAGGFVAPGALQIFTAETPLDQAVARQCLTVTAGEAYDVGGWFRAVPGQPDVLRGYMGVTWFSGPGCTSAVGSVTTNVSDATPGTWLKVAAQSLVAPATAQAAFVYLAFLRPNGGAQGHFDDVYFGTHPTTPVELQEFSIE